MFMYVYYVFHKNYQQNWNFALFSDLQYHCKSVIGLLTLYLVPHLQFAKFLNVFLDEEKSSKIVLTKLHINTCNIYFLSGV